MSTASHPTLRDAIHRCDHLEPELPITIKNQVFERAFKGKRLPHLLGNPTTRRMLRDINVQDAPPIMTDDEEAVLMPRAA
jgi:hypothetical protein